LPTLNQSPDSQSLGFSKYRRQPKGDFMPDANGPETSTSNILFVGEMVTIKGEIAVPDTLVVCGMVEGDVSVGNLVVRETGVIKGRIVVAQNAEIFGKVFEKLDVKFHLILRPNSRVDGNVSYGTLQIEEGASIAGGINSNSRNEQKPAKGDLSQRQDQKPPRHDRPSGNGAWSLTQLDPIEFGSPVSAPSAH
jgi:cytoskeletal protein CcmA (bactofilin family)